MGVFNFFKRPQHQKFDYKPRFYDPVKEDREARMARYKDADETEFAKSRISSGFRRRTARGYGGGNSRQSNIRLVVILVVLILLTYYFIQTYLPQIIEIIE